MDKLFRSESDRIVGGVAGGMARYLNLDPLLLRIVFVVMAMINGIGLAIYLLLWLIVPVEQASFESQEEILRQNADEIRKRGLELSEEAQRAIETKWGTGAGPGKGLLAVGAVLVGAGLLFLLSNIGLLWWVGKLWPFVLIALGAVLLLNSLKDQR